MPYSCPICSDLLDRAPQAPDNNNYGGNIACAPCGHLFHAYCIYKWIGGDLPTNRQCPCCRKAIPNKRCLPLFPNVHDDSFLDDTFNNNCNHGPELQELKKKVKDLETAKNRMEEVNKTLREDVKHERQLKMTERQRNEHWQIRCGELASIKDHADQLGRRCEEYEATIRSLQKIQNVIDSVQSHVDAMGDYPVTKESVDTLKSMNGALTKEMKAVMLQSKEAKRKQEELRQINLKANHEIKSLNSMNGSLRNTVETLKIELEELRLSNGIDVDKSIIKLPTPQMTPARKRKGGDMYTSTTPAAEKRERQAVIGDDSVIEITPSRSDSIPDLFIPTNSKFLNIKAKSASSLLDVAGPSISKSNKYVNPLKRGLKKKPTASSSSDLLDAEKMEKKSMASTSKSSTSSSQPEGKMRHMKTSSDYDAIDFPAVGYSSNLKSTIHGLPLSGTPVGTFSRLQAKDSRNRIHGVPKAPRILKK